MPPGVEFNPNKNLVVMFANICACTIHAYDDPKCWQMKRQGQMIQQWCKLCDKVWMYNYNYTMLVNKSTLTPTVINHPLMAIAQGSSELSISLVVERSAGPDAVRALHAEFLRGGGGGGRE